VSVIRRAGVLEIDTESCRTKHQQIQSSGYPGHRSPEEAADTLEDQFLPEWTNDLELLSYEQS